MTDATPAETPPPPPPPPPAPEPVVDHSDGTWWTDANGDWQKVDPTPARYL